MKKVWDTPITQERKDWATQYLEKKLTEKHEGRLTQEAAVALTKKDSNVERIVGKHKLKMRASDLAWAWVAQKIQDGQAVGEVFRPELGPLNTPQVPWQLQAQALTGWDVLVTREILRRVALSRKVLQSIYRVTDKDRAMKNGVLVEELPGMDLEAVMMTPRLAHLVWKNVNKLQGLRGAGVGRERFWACMHMLMWESLIEGSVGKHQRVSDRDWDGMAEEMQRLKAIEKGETYVFNPSLPLRGSLGDSPDGSEEAAEDAGRDCQRNRTRDRSSSRSRSADDAGGLRGEGGGRKRSRTGEDRRGTGRHNCNGDGGAAKLRGE